MCTVPERRGNDCSSISLLLVLCGGMGGILHTAGIGSRVQMGGGIYHTCMGTLEKIGYFGYHDCSSSPGDLGNMVGQE